MGKSESELVHLAGQHVFELFSAANGSAKLLYHGYKRARGLVGDVRDAAKGNELGAEAAEVALLAAWFHDSGFAVAKEGGGERSIELARAFLESQGRGALGEAIAACLRGAGGEANGNLASDVLHDALLAPIAGKGYLDEAELLRLEEEQRDGAARSEVQWTQGQIDFLQKNSFRTRWAQLEWGGGRVKNLARLQRQLRRQMGEATEQQEEEEAKNSKSTGRMAAGLFGDLTRNQLRSLSIADRRTNTMIHVNAIMISLLVGLVLRKIDEHRQLLMPTVVLLCVNVAVVILSIVSLRAGRELRGIRSETHTHDANLLLTATDVQMSLSDYMARMGGLVANGSSLQKAMFECLYFGRNLIRHRRRSLQLTYDIFIWGLAASLVLFLVAMVRA
jgi:predicted metal-dependent HD superfamily phosphohydrolase